MENKELKIKHLIALRTNYFSMIMLISGGVAGLFFGDFLNIKTLILIAAGTYFDCLFIMKFLYTSVKIEKLTEE